jgi:hypothetical protein
MYAPIYSVDADIVQREVQAIASAEFIAADTREPADVRERFSALARSLKQDTKPFNRGPRINDAESAIDAHV